MPYLGTQLTMVLKIKEVVTIHYFEYEKNFIFSGEAHDFWEFVCVDNGTVEIGADDRLYQLEALLLSTLIPLRACLALWQGFLLAKNNSGFPC